MASDHSAYTHDCDLTLFIACYNEERGIIPTIETVVAAVTEIGLSYDIVIIDDCSTDRSVEMILGYLKEHASLPITLYVNGVNQGLGSNYAEGAFRGTGRYYRLICGDNVESKETLVTIFKKIGEADMIIPYPAASVRGVFRRCVSQAYTSLVNLLSGHRIRYYNGLPVNLRYNVMRWHSHSHGFGFQADLTTRLLDLKATYVEVPVYPTERADGESKAFRFRNICSVAHTLLDIFIRRLGVLVYPRAAYQAVNQLRVYRASELDDGQTVKSFNDAELDPAKPPRSA
jgi:glycosyltransferase involved in cell wall biosynthesis